MSNGLMNLIAGILVFLAALIPIITSIWRWATQKGVQRPVIGVCLGLVALAFSVTGLIGFLGKWDASLVLLFMFGYVVFYAASFAVPGGVPSRIEIAIFVAALSTQVFLIGVFYMGPKLDALRKSEQPRELKAESTPLPK